jgi:DNA mismatch repair protein MutS2
VPIDVELGRDFDTLIITGPKHRRQNRHVKDPGAVVSDEPVRAAHPRRDGSELPVFTKVLADIGDEQSIEQSLSTFSPPT